MTGYVCPKCSRIYLGDVTIIDGACFICAVAAARGDGNYPGFLDSSDSREDGGQNG